MYLLNNQGLHSITFEALQSVSAVLTAASEFEGFGQAHGILIEHEPTLGRVYLNSLRDVDAVGVRPLP